jgi:hypothetical protein
MIEWTLVVFGFIVSVSIYNRRRWMKKLFRTKLSTRLLANSNAFYK